MSIRLNAFRRHVVHPAQEAETGFFMTLIICSHVVMTRCCDDEVTVLMICLLSLHLKHTDQAFKYAITYFTQLIDSAKHYYDNANKFTEVRRYTILLYRVSKGSGKP